MAVVVADECAKLHAAYAELTDQLGAVPLVGASEGGRALSLSASEIEARLALIEKRAAQLGCPIGGVGEPACVYSRARA